MAHPLLSLKSVDVPPEPFLSCIGEIFARFDRRTQDSGNVSYGVRVDAERYFVKTAGDPADEEPFLSHDQRVGLLRNAAILAGRVRHQNLPELRHVIESPHGPMLIYSWADGELLGVSRDRRTDPASPFQRFRALPVTAIALVLNAIYDVHEKLAADGWVAVDFYDGCLIYDFPTGRLAIVDLDHYHPGPFLNQMGRMFGASRFMAPEEFERGATIDQRTTVFTLARTALIFLGDGTTDPAAFGGSAAQLDVLTKACASDPGDRFGTVAEFSAAWRTP